MNTSILVRGCVEITNRHILHFLMEINWAEFSFFSLKVLV